MSLFGAMRIAIDGWRQPETGRPDEPLVAVRSGAWAAWARGGTTDPAIDAAPGAACVTSDGRPGRVVAAPGGDTPRLVCEPI